jgi:hypothetical protein
MKQSKSKKKQAITVNQGELLFPDLKFLSPLCLKILLLWKAEQLFDLALRMSELSSALKRYDDFPDDEISHLFYSKLDRSIENKFVDYTLAACVEFKIITMDELETFALAGHTDINITTLQKSFEFARGVLKIKINELYSLVMLASACSVLSSVYRLNKESMQENILKTFIAMEHRLTNKACEAIGYWTAKLEERRRNKEGGAQVKKEKGEKNKESIKKIMDDLGISSMNFKNNKTLKEKFYNRAKKETGLYEKRISEIGRNISKE